MLDVGGIRIRRSHVNERFEMTLAAKGVEPVPSWTKGQEWSPPSGASADDEASTASARPEAYDAEG